ncbi:MAG TPA: acetoacetate decarboxylase family protein, partial [Thermoleophilia bacterium]|nr:acetoacetate decarboxylase family protein [Thermoleophilia bacterium]
MSIRTGKPAAIVPVTERNALGAMRDLSFFRGVPQSEVREGGHAFRIPAFYYDVTHFSVGFLAPLDTLRELLPSAEIYPLRATPRHGLLHLGVFEYRDSDVGPYNEVSISVAALPGVSAPVGTGLLKAVREGPTAYVWQLPVTTEIARYLGVEFYGFPKFLAEIEIQVRD